MSIRTSMIAGSVMLMVSALPAFARVVNLEPGQSYYLGDTQVYCGGGGGGYYPPGDSYSKVSLDCVQQLDLSYPGKPDVQTVVMWADQCRTVGLHNPNCTIVDSRFNNYCYGRLYQLIPGTVPTDDVMKLQNACRDYTLRCY